MPNTNGISEISVFVDDSFGGTGVNNFNYEIAAVNNAPYFIVNSIEYRNVTQNITKDEDDLDFSIAVVAQDYDISTSEAQSLSFEISTSKVPPRMENYAKN